MTRAFFPVPAAYAGDPPAADGLRHALALATDGELRLVMHMLAMGAKMTSGMGERDQVTVPLQGAAALFGWLAAVVVAETDRRVTLFGGLAGDGED